MSPSSHSSRPNLAVLHNKKALISIVLIAVGMLLLFFSVPAIMRNAAFTAYEYEGGNAQIDELLDLAAAGALLLSFGILLLLKFRIIIRR